MVYWLEQENTYYVRTLQEALALRLLPLTSIRMGADISPDGEQVAFVDMDQHLVVFDLTNGEATYIPQPSSLSLYGYIRWSPDGRQLLYLAYDNEQNYHESFYLVTPGEDDIVNITPWRGSKGTFNWSPDGQWIAFYSDHLKVQSEYPPRDKLYLLNTTCLSSPETCYSGLVPLGDAFDEATRSPAWSPDGRQLAFTCTLDGQYGICAMNMDGSNLVQIYHREGVDWWTYAIYGLRWSPDGETIAFTLAENSDDPDPRNYDSANHDLSSFRQEAVRRLSYQILSMRMSILPFGW
jgi:dipeptidyl aminopeptidase/acylaminoacyl peptidase